MRQFTGTVTRIELVNGLLRDMLRIQLTTENGRKVAYYRNRVRIEYGSSDHRLVKGDTVRVEPHRFRKTILRIQ